METYTRKPNFNCIICGKAIYKRPKEIKEGCVYCSRACYGISCRKEIPCVVCGKLILASKHSKTCSRACSNKNREGIKYKIGAPNCNFTRKEKLKTILIKERGAKCERCSYCNIDILQVHHKIRKADGGTDDLNNLELLCPNCHYEHHFGRNPVG